MFPFPIATPQGCNIQTFYGPGTSTGDNVFAWTKPVGISHVYIMLIGGGGTGDGANAGGSGAVTVWYGSAQHVPPNLQLVIGGAEQSAFVYAYTSASGGRSSLLRASAGVGATAGASVTAPAFAASGFYQSVAGQNSSNNPGASTSTFLSAGAANAAATATANYGYQLISGSNTGFFQMQPIIVGLGSKSTGSGAVGCGAGPNGTGGPGMVLIASW